MRTIDQAIRKNWRCFLAANFFRSSWGQNVLNICRSYYLLVVSRIVFCYLATAVFLIFKWDFSEGKIWPFTGTIYTALFIQLTPATTNMHGTKLFVRYNECSLHPILLKTKEFSRKLRIFGINTAFLYYTLFCLYKNQ